VTDTTHDQALTAWRGRQPRFVLAGALLVTVVVGLVVALIVGLGSPHSTAAPRAGAGEHGVAPAVTAKAGAPPSATQGGVPTTGARSNVAEVADPTEASSFPAPASVRHKAATTPAKAGEQAVAAGAPSDAEVRKELAQMQAVERAAKQTQQKSLTPVKGGESIGGNGTLPIPTNVPEVIQRVVAGANAIADFPYVFGGGHGSFVDNAYDCSGSVSYALAAGGLLGSPETSGELESWGAAGPGRYITVYANAGHTYMYVDGILYDTAGRSGVYASRWLVSPVDNTGYVARHWPGL
jgi:cell wall-associated NlpC family hydrolase